VWLGWPGWGAGVGYGYIGTDIKAHDVRPSDIYLTCSNHTAKCSDYALITDLNLRRYIAPLPIKKSMCYSFFNVATNKCSLR